MLGVSTYIFYIRSDSSANERLVRLFFDVMKRPIVHSSRVWLKCVFPSVCVKPFRHTIAPTRLTTHCLLYKESFCAIPTMAQPRQSVQFHEIQNRMPVFSELIASRAGKGLEFETLCKLMACSKEFRKKDVLPPMYAQHKKRFLEFFSNRKAACEEVTSQLSLTLCFDKMIEYKEEPFFLDVMKAMLETSALRRPDEPVVARQQMVRARALLENYDWKNFCAQLEVYQEFHVIVEVFIDYILDVVTDKRRRYFHRMYTEDGAASGGVTTEEYFDQKHLILGNMGDAGVVECIWTVCRYHSTFMSTQQKLMNILCEMSESRSVSCVRNVLKIPGHMHILYDISSFDDFTNAHSNPNWTLSNYTVCNRNLVSLIRVMFTSGPLFTAHEEIEVVAMVHSVIATRNIMDDALLALLSVVSEHVRTSTLRALTGAQIHALCDNSAIQAAPMAMQYVSTLLYLSYAAKGIFDTSEIPYLVWRAR